MNVNRFKQLLESTLGNVKPLLSEATNPPIGDEPGEGTVEVTPEKKDEIKQEIYAQLPSLPNEVKLELGIGDNTDKESAIESILTHSHFHLDPLKKHMEIQLPGLGKHHNIKPVIDFSYGSHSSSHGEHDVTSSLSKTLKPSTLVNVGVTLPLNTIFGKGH